MHNYAIIVTIAEVFLNLSDIAVIPILCSVELLPRIPFINLHLKRFPDNGICSYYPTAGAVSARGRCARCVLLSEIFICGKEKAIVFQILVFLGLWVVNKPFSVFTD